MTKTELQNCTKVTRNSDGCVFSVINIGAKRMQLQYDGPRHFSHQHPIGNKPADMSIECLESFSAGVQPVPSHPTSCAAGRSQTDIDRLQDVWLSRQP